MNRLEKELGKDDYERVKEDIKKALLNRKKEFCEADYVSVKECKGSANDPGNRDNDGRSRIYH